MNSEIRPSLHALLSYTLLLVLLIFMAKVTIAPAYQTRLDKLSSITSLQEQNARFSNAINSYTAAIAENNLIESELSEATVARFLHAETPALAGAQLQALLKNLIAEAGGELNSSSTLRGENDEPFSKISVNLRLRCSIETLKVLLFQIELQTPSLYVDNLVIQSRHQIGRNLSSLNDELEVRLDVIGYMDLSGDER